MFTRYPQKSNTDSACEEECLGLDCGKDAALFFFRSMRHVLGASDCNLGPCDELLLSIDSFWYS